MAQKLILCFCGKERQKVSKECKSDYMEIAAQAVGRRSGQ